MKKVLVLAACLAMAGGTSERAAADIISAAAVSDIQWIGGAGSDRNEQIVGAFNGQSRSGHVFFDTSAYLPFFNAGRQLIRAEVVLTERSGRNNNNGTLSGNIFAGLQNPNNSGITHSSAAADYFGNSGSRLGNVGGGTTGNNNLDPASSVNNVPGMGAAVLNHTFTTAIASEVLTIDLTNGSGLTLAEITTILSDDATTDAGILIDTDINAQVFFTSIGTSTPTSTINGVAQTPVALTRGEGATGSDGAGPVLVLEFAPVVIPEPGSLALLSLMGVAIGMRRRR